MVATEETASAERQAQKTYWLQHSSQPTVEAMMLDSKASEIDQLERPEVSANAGGRLCHSRNRHGVKFRRLGMISSDTPRIIKILRFHIDPSDHPCI